MHSYDLIVRGGTVIDPAAGVHAPMDVAVRDGAIAAVEADLSAATATETFDATGLIVTPGLIDLHVHVFASGSRFGIDADTYCLARGTTTVLDAGTPGAYNWPAFQRDVEAASTRIFALLNISGIGIPANGELYDADWADPDAAAAVVDAHRDRIIGIKIRMSPRVVGPNLAYAFDMALQAAAAAELPLVIHPNAADMPMADILSRLRPGDMVTHCFNTSEQAVVDAKGKVRPEAIDARDRGVLFDVGHGLASFNFNMAEQALDQGFAPDTISTDLFALNIDSLVCNLPHVLSKFLALGMSLDDVIARATAAAARFLPADETLGTLAVGAPADITVMQQQTGEFTFVDARKNERRSNIKLAPSTTIKGGRIVGS